jgi:hypothetical protein
VLITKSICGGWWRTWKTSRLPRIEGRYQRARTLQGATKATREGLAIPRSTHDRPSPTAEQQRQIKQRCKYHGRKNGAPQRLQEVPTVSSLSARDLLVDPLTLCDVPLPMLREIPPHLSQAFCVKPALLPLIKNRVENVGQIDADKNSPHDAIPLRALEATLARNGRGYPAFSGWLALPATTVASAFSRNRSRSGSRKPWRQSRYDNDGRGVGVMSR